MLKRLILNLNDNRFPVEGDLIPDLQLLLASGFNHPIEQHLTALYDDLGLSPRADHTL